MPAPKTPRADAATIKARVEEVLNLRLDGLQFHNLLQYSSEKGWGVGERQLREYMARADKLLVERQDRNRKQVIARHIAQRQALYARAVNAADFRTALAILADEAKLRGLYEERDLRDLLRLATAQGARIEELERRLRDEFGEETPAVAGRAVEETEGAGAARAG